MKLDLNKFYNSNYKEFVHKEAVEEALRMVAEIDLKEVEIDTILSITFSVDEFGENPMYVDYLDKEGKKHIVRIRPAVTNEIQEMLKRYVTLEQHETDKQDIYNHLEHMHVPMEIRSQNGLDEDGNKFIVLNNDNSYLSFQVDPETDDEIQWLCIHNKGGLGTQSMYFARFMDYAKVDQVPSNAEFLEQIQQLEDLIQRKSQETLQSSKEYADTQDNALRTEIMSNVTDKINETKNGILSYVDVEIDNLKEYVDSRDAEYHELAKRYTDNAKQEAVNSCKTYTDTKSAETLETSKTYTDTKHTEVTQHVTELENDMNTNFATKQEMLTNVESLSDIDQQNFETLSDKINTKATVYKKKLGDSVRYNLPQINVTTKTDGDIILEGKDETTVKLANLLNDEQLAKLKNLPDSIPAPGISEEQLNTKLNDYLLKNKIKYNDGEFSKINFVHGSNDSVQVHDSSGNLSMTGNFITDTQASEITNATAKLSTVADTHKVPDSYWYGDHNIGWNRYNDDGDFISEAIGNVTTNKETMVYLPKFKSAKQSDLNNKTNSYLWDTIENRTIDFEEGNEVFYDVADNKILKIGVKNKRGEPQKEIRFDQFLTLENLASVIGNSQPIEINVSYNGINLELNNYSSYTTIGDTTIVNINCNFTAPFTSGSTPILNTLNINAETLKSFPRFMMDCIVKTATNVSSYTTTTVFSNTISNLYVETPVIAPDETIETSLISFNGSYIFNNTKEAENDD